MLGQQSEEAPNPTWDVDMERRRRLLEEAVEGHERELLAGIRAYVWRFRLAQNRASVESLVEEVWHDTVVAALKSLEGYDDERPPIPWLLGIALNLVRRRLRGDVQRNLVYPISSRMPRLSAAARNSEPSEEPDLDPAAEFEEDALLERLATDELLSLVGENDRQVLRLAYVEGLGGRELAARLGISEGAAHTRLSRARTRLRKAYYESSGQGLG